MIGSRNPEGVWAWNESGSSYFSNILKKFNKSKLVHYIVDLNHCGLQLISNTPQKYRSGNFYPFYIQYKYRAIGGGRLKYHSYQSEAVLFFFPKLKKLNISAIYEANIFFFFCESNYGIYLQVL